MHLHRERLATDAGDGGNITQEVVIELVIERNVDGIANGGQEERMAVRCGLHHCLGRDIASGAGSVLNDEWLTKPLGQPLSQQAREDVGRAAGGKTDDDAHRPCRKSLRPCQARYGRERCSARCQMEELAAEKFHSITSWAVNSRFGGTVRPSAFAVRSGIRWAR